MTLSSWVPPRELKPAPGALLLVQAFVNTRNLDLGTDLLADPGSARQWLRQAGLLGPRATASAGELRSARAVREGVRALVTFNAGAPPVTAAPPAPGTGPAPRAGTTAEPAADPAPGDALAALEAFTRESRLRLTLGDDGQFLLEPEPGGGLADRLAGLLLIIRDAQRDGTWARLKICGNDECRWAFYDRSHSRRGAWCDMSSCGNIIKNRNLRARRASHGHAAQPRPRA